MSIGNILGSILPPERIKTRLIDRLTYASDAGFYHLVPQAVVQPVSEQEIREIFRISKQHRIPVTFRTAGTSLSGQSITDGILVDLSQHWNQVKIESGGDQVRVLPGAIGAYVNACLKKFGKKIGPDPSSIDSAMMGGILSNNSSGMCCGVQFNSYHTTRAIRFILPDGSTFSTERPEDYTRFEKERQPVFNEINRLRNSILADEALKNRIRRKYAVKNTVGYSLNAFIDFEHPLDILAHLLIGAEGTLGFIAEAVMETIPDFSCKSTALLYFPDIYNACKAIVPLTEAGAAAVELMDRASLRSIEHIKGVPEILKTLPESTAALLIEFQGNSREDLGAGISRFLAATAGISLLNPPEFTEDPKQQAFLWKLRKGMFPAVGAVRAKGTTVILEDVAFPVEKLGDAILDLQQLFRKHRYDNAIIFGHAKDGNIHFVVTQDFAGETEVQRYEAFMNDVVELVVNRYDGALKAEHGTGRNMAPFVETEWGPEAYRVMQALKQAVDPDNLLNPGVIINEDKKAHLKHLKALPEVEEEVDKCIECGYCEHKCPSRNLTMTPRRRIVARRQLSLLKSAGEHAQYRQLLKEYQYDGLDTCAVDGLCATACPVDIDTGMLVKRLRRENHSSTANAVASWTARNFGLVSAAVKGALIAGTAVNSIFGKNAMLHLTKGLKKIVPSFPLWSNQLHPTKSGRDRRPMPQGEPGRPGVVYFPSCISRVMGQSPKSGNTIEVFERVAARAGVEVVIPEGVQHHCCGQIYSSKGFGNAYAYTINATIEKLWLFSRNGELPVVLDITSCTSTLQHCRPALSEENKARFDRLRIIDSVVFLYDYVMPKVTVTSRKNSIALHPVCSLQKMGLSEKFRQLAAHFSKEVKVPVRAGCCGMAGDRGFLFPELTRSATAGEVAEVNCASYEGYYSSSKTCEMALSDHSGKAYESILHLIDECTA